MGRVNIFYQPNDVAGKMQTCFWAPKPFSEFETEAAKLWLDVCRFFLFCSRSWMSEVLTGFPAVQVDKVLSPCKT